MSVYLITGVSGYIGSVLTKYFPEKKPDSEVFVIALHRGGCDPYKSHPPLKFIHALSYPGYGFTNFLSNSGLK